MASIPMKMSMIKYINDNPNASLPDIMAGLKEEYGSERQFNFKNMFHLMATLKASVFVEVSGYYEDEDGELMERYKLMDAGVASLRYIPKV